MGFQMRNGPQTWPINGHGSIDWMQQCDGEMSPRQYTALIRRASSLHYRPKHFLNHHSGGSDLTDKTSDREIILKTDQTCASIDKGSLLGIRCLERQRSLKDNYSRVLASSVSFMPINIDENFKFPHGRNCRLSQSFRLPNSTALVKQFSSMNINSQNNDHKGDSEPKLFVKLSSSTHLSESNDFQTQESSSPKYSAKDISNKEAKLRKCKAVMNLQLTRETDNFSPEIIATGSVNGPQTMQLDTLHKATSAKTLIPLLSSTSSSVKSRSLSCLPSSPSGVLSSPTIHPSSPTYFTSTHTDVPSPPSPLPSPKANLSPLLSVMSLTHYHPTSSPSVTSSVQPLFLSPSDIKAQPKHLYERPYYDCGYDTDYDSTPPHSSPECDDGKLKAIDSSQVWSRYLAWLHRMTKTQS